LSSSSEEKEKEIKILLAIANKGLLPLTVKKEKGK